jgi:hypothetical protein
MYMLVFIRAVLQKLETSMGAIPLSPLSLLYLSSLWSFKLISLVVIVIWSCQIRVTWHLPGRLALFFFCSGGHFPPYLCKGRTFAFLNSSLFSNLIQMSVLYALGHYFYTVLKHMRRQMSTTTAKKGGKRPRGQVSTYTYWYCC